MNFTFLFFLNDLYVFLLFLQSFGIGFKKMHPDGSVRVHANDPQPIIRVKPSESSRYQRFGFVDAVLNLDPDGRLGLLSSDYRVCFPVVFLSVVFLCCLFFLLFCFSAV